MGWAAKSPQYRHHQALPPAGETVPSRRHNQTDSESGKEANEADTEEVQVSTSFFFGLVGGGALQY
jgi:hypothetical protein